MRRIFGWALALVALLGASALPAQAQRALPVPANKGWQHAATGVILRSTIVGLPRTQLTDSTSAEFDVAARFTDSSETTIVSVFIFRPGMQSVPVWFDRADTQVLLNQVYGKAAPVAAPLAFAPPRATATSGLRRVYVPTKGPFKSTALAMIPLGEWLVAIRVSSKELDAAQIDAKLNEVIAAVGWPQKVAESPAAVPVEACAAPLAYAKRAKMKKPDMGDAILGGALAGAMADDPEFSKASPLLPTLFCRDLVGTTRFGVYRAPDATDLYVMALGDAGRVLRVNPALVTMDDKPGFSVVLLDVDGSTAIYPGFDKLAPPDKVFDAVLRNAPISRTSADGKNVTINVGS